MASSGIVYASFDRFPAPKGAAVHIRAFVDALGAAFGPVDLVAIGDAPDAPAPALGPNVTYHPLGARGKDLVAQALTFRSHLGAWWQGRPRAKVVHVRSIFEGYPIARRKASLTDALVYEVNGLPSIELKYHHPDVADDAELLRKLLAQEAACLQAADLLVTPSAVTAEYLLSRGADPRRLRVIPNGVDLDVFRHAPPRAPEPGRPLRMLYSGTMTAWQGVHHALDACRLLRRDLPVVLTLVGPLRKHARRALLDRCGDLLLQGAVELLEPLPQDALARLHHACDVVLVPLPVNDRNCVQGCCPLKLLEAMATGTPVVVSDLPVVRALAEATEAYRVRPGSPKAIAEAVKDLAAHPALGAALSANARARVERDFPWGRAQQALVSAYADDLGIARASTRDSTSASAPD
ncbi:MULTISPECIES: glycosyltransferase family 4 protein [Corallococcus]|uniref:glycosyltransferase family 4 protein n=1 Tax=Corallococcus TaxID=83461 RepID=UPI001180B3A5|nr:MULTISPECIES: glycosyltransferase family 4 protein [Corallococcus]NBD10175.1 glycosyltransferase [Corallococcus silvisoli]TSC27411.1 glycosyltransferase family 4 protein [Corallococcus sp. Z5C101001]